MTTEFSKTAVAILPFIEDAIAEDSSRSSWDASQWRVWFNEVGIYPIDFTVTRKTLMDKLGVVKTQILLEKIRSSPVPDLADQLKVSEGGVNINHGEWDAMTVMFVDADPVDPETDTSMMILQSDVDAIGDLAYDNIPRYTALGIGSPREAAVNCALELLQ